MPPKPKSARAKAKRLAREKQTAMAMRMTRRPTAGRGSSNDTREPMPASDSDSDTDTLSTVFYDANEKQGPQAEEMQAVDPIAEEESTHPSDMDTAVGSDDESEDDTDAKDLDYVQSSPIDHREISQVSTRRQSGEQQIVEQDNEETWLAKDKERCQMVLKSMEAGVETLAKADKAALKREVASLEASDEHQTGTDAKKARLKTALPALVGEKRALAKVSALYAVDQLWDDHHQQ